MQSAHGNVDVVLPHSCAGNHVRKFSVRLGRMPGQLRWMLFAPWCGRCDRCCPASDSWLAALAETPTLKLAFDKAFIEKIVYELTRRDSDPERCAKKGWNLGTFTVVTFRQAVAVLIAQYFRCLHRCAVTANALTLAKSQLNPLRVLQECARMEWEVGCLLEEDCVMEEFSKKPPSAARKVSGWEGLREAPSEAKRAASSSAHGRMPLLPCPSR